MTLKASPHNSRGFEPGENLRKVRIKKISTLKGSPSIMLGHSFGSRNNVATRHNPCKHGFCSHCSVVSECNYLCITIFRRFFEPAAIIRVMLSASYI